MDCIYEWYKIKPVSPNTRESVQSIVKVNTIICQLLNIDIPTIKSYDLKYECKWNETQEHVEPVQQYNNNVNNIQQTNSNAVLIQQMADLNQKMIDRNLMLQRMTNNKSKPKQWYMDLLTLPNKPFLIEVPEKYRDAELIAAYEAAGAYVELRDIPKGLLTEDKIRQFMSIEKQHLSNIPMELRTASIVDAFINDDGLAETADIPKDLLTRERVLRLIENISPSKFDFVHVPNNMMDQEFIDKLKAKNKLFISMVPKNLLTPELCTELYKSRRADIKDIPKSKMTSEVAMFALGRGFMDLEAIPVKLRDLNVCVAYCRKSQMNITYVPPKLVGQVNAQLMQ